MLFKSIPLLQYLDNRWCMPIIFLVDKLKIGDIFILELIIQEYIISELFILSIVP